MEKQELCSPQRGRYWAQVLCPLHHGRKNRITSWHSPIIMGFLVGFLFAICSRRVGVMLSNASGGRAEGTEIPVSPMADVQLGHLRQPTIPCLRSCCWLS